MKIGILWKINLKLQPHTNAYLRCGIVLLSTAEYSELI